MSHCIPLSLCLSSVVYRIYIYTPNRVFCSVDDESPAWSWCHVLYMPEQICPSLYSTCTTTIINRPMHINDLFIRRDSISGKSTSINFRNKKKSNTNIFLYYTYKLSESNRRSNTARSPIYIYSDILLTLTNTHTKCVSHAGCRTGNEKAPKITEC